MQANALMSAASSCCDLAWTSWVKHQYLTISVSLGLSNAFDACIQPATMMHLRIGVLDEGRYGTTAHARQHKPQAAALQEAGQQGKEIGMVLRVQCVRLLHDQILQIQPPACLDVSGWTADLCISTESRHGGKMLLGAYGGRSDNGLHCAMP